MTIPSNDLLVNEPFDDVAEITIGTADIDVFAFYGREARQIHIVDAGTTGVLKVDTRRRPGRVYTELVAGLPVEPSPFYVKKIYGTDDGSTTVGKVRLGF